MALNGKWWVCDISLPEEDAHGLLWLFAGGICHFGRETWSVRVWTHLWKWPLLLVFKTIVLLFHVSHSYEQHVLQYLLFTTCVKDQWFSVGGASRLFQYQYFDRIPEQYFLLYFFYILHKYNCSIFHKSTFLSFIWTGATVAFITVQKNINVLLKYFDFFRRIFFIFKPYTWFLITSRVLDFSFCFLVLIFCSILVIPKLFSSQYHTGTIQQHPTLFRTQIKLWI